jgi:chromosome segregation ATPase
MNTPEQLSQMVVQHTKDIAAVWESTKSAHHRLNENAEIISSIHKLAANMENLTVEVKKLAERLENGLREQGKRIGEAETALIKMANLEAYVKKANERLDKIEREPADKWKNLTAQIITLLVAAVVGGIITFLIK